MSLDLCLFPDPILGETCEPVEDPAQHESLIDRMSTIMHDRDGVGIAAPQLGTPLEIFVICVDFEEPTDEVFINPEIISVDEYETLEEGCLSFPNIRVDLERGLQVEVEATRPSGERVKRSLEGIQAQCVQHEMDHLQGKTLLDRCDLTQKMEINDKIQMLKNGKIPDPPEDSSVHPERKSR